MSFSVPTGVLPLEVLAEARGIPFAKFSRGLGQEQMAVPAPDEDIITLAAQAGHQVLDGEDLEAIDLVILATESGIDQSKAGAIYVHGLLGLPSTCRAFEVKQACCSSTAALQMAMASVALRPDKKVLILATDEARYGLGTAGEPTQGAGALAMLVSTNPRLLEVDQEFGSYTADVMDFWRPNYRDEACVDGKYSIKVYLHALTSAFDEYHKRTGADFSDFNRFCYHLPFTKMGSKAHHHLRKHAGLEAVGGAAEIEAGLTYNRRIGNTYTASLHISICSLLENSTEDLSDQRVGLFSYGSGCMGTFLSARVVPGYADHLLHEFHRERLDSRTPLDMPTYEAWYTHLLPTDGSTYETPVCSRHGFRLSGIEDHRRLYSPAGEIPPSESTPAPTERQLKRPTAPDSEAVRRKSPTLVEA